MNAEAWDQAVRASRTYVFTEPLFHRLFDRFIRPITGGDAVVFLRGFESQVMAGEHMQWKLARAARSLPKVSSRIQTYKPEEAWRRIEADPACRSWAKQLTAFCQSHGHLNANLDYLHETMADDPAKAIQSIRLRMESEGEDPLSRHAQLGSEREKTTAQAREKLRRHPLRKALFEWALAWAQEGASTRENIFFFALRGWPLARRALLRLGTILVQTGTLNRREDVFFLNWEEVQQALRDGTPTNWQAIVAERRAAQEHRSTLNPPARIPEEGAPVTFRRKVTAALKQCILGRKKQVDDGVLWGAPVSPGVVTGPAQIICSVEDVSRLKPGNILVTRAATPEWTSTFTIAAGLITDVGGPLSHSSIIAREFGLPTVMGVRTATTAISEGQLITIDGAKGFIQLH